MSSKISFRMSSEMTLAFLVILVTILSRTQRTNSQVAFRVHDIDHMKEHLPVSIDLARLKDEDLLFHYFRVHDSDDNNKLDGCELLQSILHFHNEASVTYRTPAKVLSDLELSTMVDAILESDDKNMDGFIDYREFLFGQVSRGL